MGRMDGLSLSLALSDIHRSPKAFFVDIKKHPLAGRMSGQWVFFGLQRLAEARPGLYSAMSAAGVSAFGLSVAAGATGAAAV